MGITAMSAAGLVGATLAVGAGTGAAEPASLTLSYTCPFPLIGEQAMSVEINADVPSSAVVGEPTPEFTVESVATVPATATQGLSLVGAKTIEGSGLADASVAAPEATLDVQVPVDVEKTDVPASGAFDVAATGSAPSLTFTEAGQATITVGDLLLTLTPRTADGSETGLGTFDAPCTLDAGQDATLADFEILPSGGDDGGGSDGGDADGGDADGGAADGGVDTGGDVDGGADTGGDVDGGADTGGTDDGNAAGGDVDGGTDDGGSGGTGGTAVGGTDDGTDAGGTDVGGAAAGGDDVGGSSAGGASAGGTSAGGVSAGGTAVGGTSAGGTSVGGVTPAASDSLALTGVSLLAPLGVGLGLIAAGALLVLTRRRRASA